MLARFFPAPQPVLTYVQLMKRIPSICSGFQPLVLRVTEALDKFMLDHTSSTYDKKRAQKLKAELQGAATRTQVNTMLKNSLEERWSDLFEIENNSDIHSLNQRLISAIAQRPLIVREANIACEKAFLSTLFDEKGIQTLRLSYLYRNPTLFSALARICAPYVELANPLLARLLESKDEYLCPVTCIDAFVTLKERLTLPQKNQLFDRLISRLKFYSPYTYQGWNKFYSFLIYIQPREKIQSVLDQILNTTDLESRNISVLAYHLARQLKYRRKEATLFMLNNIPRFKENNPEFDVFAKEVIAEFNQAAPGEVPLGLTKEEVFAALLKNIGKWDRSLFGYGLLIEFCHVVSIDDAPDFFKTLTKVWHENWSHLRIAEHGVVKKIEANLRPEVFHFFRGHYESLLESCSRQLAWYNEQRDKEISIYSQPPREMKVKDILLVIVNEFFQKIKEACQHGYNGEQDIHSEIDKCIDKTIALILKEPFTDRDELLSFFKDTFDTILRKQCYANYSLYHYSQPVFMVDFRIVSELIFEEVFDNVIRRPFYWLHVVTNSSKQSLPSDVVRNIILPYCSEIDLEQRVSMRI